MVQQQVSVARRRTTGDGIDSIAAPPWEVLHPTVPHVAPQTSSLSSAERDALPVLWAAKENDYANYERLTNSPPLSSTSSFVPESSTQGHGNSWADGAESKIPPTKTQIARSHAASPGLTLSARTYEPPLSNGDGARVQAFPGTMSTNPSDRIPTRRHRRSATVNKHRDVALGKWLRSALQDMFKRNHVDETALEHISSHHWAEED